MEEKEFERYLSYKKCLLKGKANFIQKIRYWDFLKEDLETQIEENGKKQVRILQLKNELSSTKSSLQIANQRIEQLEYDLKQKSKKQTKKKKETK